MPEDTGFHIDDVCIPHTWYPVETDRNDVIVFLYFGIKLSAYVPAGDYTVAALAVAIADSMNNVLAQSSIAKRFDSTYTN